MKDERMDPEVLGALLDRRLAGDERAAAVAHLAASDEDRDVLADTAAVLRALEEEDAGASETETPSKVRGGGEAPAVSRPARSMPRWGWGALAAGILLALVLPGLLRRTGGLPAPERTALALAAPRAGLPRGWEDPWPISRGSGHPSELAARAARAGVLHFHLVLAFNAGDQTTRAAAAGDLRDYFAEWGPFAESYAALARADATEQDLARTGARAADLVGREPFFLGAWAEAARLAAFRRDERFFRSRATSAALARAEDTPGLPENVPAAAVALREELQREGATDWTRLQSAADRLATELTR